MNIYKDVLEKKPQPFVPFRRVIKNSSSSQFSDSLSPANASGNRQKQVNSKGSKKSKQVHNQMKKVAIIYSRVHSLLKLKHQTLFLALELYRQYWLKDLERNIPQTYLQVVCFFLASKYQDIYPPRLKQVFSNICPGFDDKQYNKYELMFLQSIGACLNIPTGMKILDKLLQNQSQMVAYHAYYVLELCYTADIIDQPYDLNEIASSIVFSMKPIKETLAKISSYNGVSINSIVDCTKMILQIKSNAVNSESSVYRKYTQPRYQVAAINGCTLEKSQIVQ